MLPRAAAAAPVVFAPDRIFLGIDLMSIFYVNAGAVPGIRGRSAAGCASGCDLHRPPPSAAWLSTRSFSLPTFKNGLHYKNSAVSQSLVFR